MSTKLALAPLLAAAALAVMPTAAQATPHWYKNGAPLEEGELGDLGSSGVDFIGWGTPAITERTFLGALRCDFIVAGDVKDPAGGGAGEGAIDAFGAFDCTSAVCEGSGGRVEVVPLGLEKGEEWTGMLVEPEPAVIRLKIGNKEAASKTKMRYDIICAAAGYNVEFHGELSPRVLNGTEIGIAPSKLEFTEGPVQLESTGSETSWFTGKWKIVGFEAQELLTAKNP